MQARRGVVGEVRLPTYKFLVVCEKGNVKKN